MKFAVPDAYRPRVIRVDLGQLAGGEGTRASGEKSLANGAETRAVPWQSDDPTLDRIGSWSGSALGLALLLESDRANPGGDAPLVIAAGDAVRRALPTAARASIASRSPLTGLYTEGQVGSDLGRRLARVADALLVEGRTSIPGAVLHVDRDGAVHLHSFPELVGRSPTEVQRALEAALGPCAALRIGRGGERGLAFASLVAGADPPSFVGRGGLGAVLGRLGLKAIAVSAEPVAEPVAEPIAKTAAPPGPTAGFAELMQLLSRSPRLRARAAGASFETALSLAAQGRFGGALSDARGWAGAPSGARKGCAGCPTPCGWVFERGEHAEHDAQGGRAGNGTDGSLRGARFGAAYALGPNLGLTNLADALELLEACDEAAVDAKELGAVLGHECRARERGLLAGPSARGDREALRARIEAIVSGAEPAIAARGADAFALAVGLERETGAAKGEAVAPESNLAVLLGQCISSRGADPMRTFPFLLEAGSRERIVRAIAPLALPEGGEDPRDPTAKGRLVWWHENLLAAIDMTGFCAFSAAGLLGDGVCELDELAPAIAPASLEVETSASPGRRLLAAGAALVVLQRELNRRYGVAADADRPAWARALLDRPGMWPEYRALRGLGPDGAPSTEALRRLGEESILDLATFGREAGRPDRTPRAGGTPRSPAARAQGVVAFVCTGPLARVLGEDVRCEALLPATVGELVAELARRRPEAARHLCTPSVPGGASGGEPIPAVYRGGARLSSADLVEDEDALVLVTALGGG